MASTYLTKTFGSAGSLTTWTFSAWVKKLGNGIEQRILSCDDDASGNNDQFFKFDSADVLQFSQYQSAYTQQIETSRKFRDTNGYYHIVLVWDTTNATAGDRTRLYVNGVRETSFSAEVQASSSLNSLINNTTYPLEIGRRGNNNTQFFDGSMSHIHFIDGTAYDASAFGETDANGVWKIKTSPSVTYGTNGFFILKDGNSVTDQSGNGNNFTVAGGTLTKTEDNPSNVFAVWNRLDTHSSATLSNGNTTFATSAVSQYEPGKCTLGFSAGKYYVEHKLTSTIGYALFLGIFKTSLNGQDQTSMDSGRYVYSCTSGDIISTSGGTLQSGLGTLTNGDILGIAVDCTNGTLDFYKNGVQQGTTVTNSEISSNEWTFGSQPRLSTTVSSNFGNGYFGTTAVASAGTNASGIGIFEYDVPTGYTALSTKGLNL